MSYIFEALQKADHAQESFKNTAFEDPPSPVNYFKFALVGLLLANGILFVMLWWPQSPVLPPTIQFSSLDEPMAQRTQPQPPSRTALPKTAQLPPLKINALKYHADPKKRLVMINTHHYTEGDELGNTLLLETIYPQGVVINYQQQRFWLPQH